MSSICAEQQHNLHTSHQLISSKKSLKTIDIPPRKLLNRRLISEPDMYFSDDTLFQKFLSNNSVGGDNLDDSDSGSDPYSSDHFRMYELKVRRCTRSRSHDWTDCPFAHPGEKARRRDPRRFHYTGQVCPEYRRGSCSRGDSCEFAHGVFECWLHPARYRTEACKDGKNCKRKVCFFAHTPRQLRVLPLNSHHSSPELACKKKLTSNHCCLFCHCANSSPTSTLLGMSHLSPPLSPPLSPGKHRSINGFSPISRYADRFVSSESSGGMHAQKNNHGVQSYKDALTELMSSLEGMNFSETSSPLCAKSPNVPWLDVSFNNETSSPLSAKSPNVPWLDVSFNNINIEDQQQFILSPSTPNPPSFSSTNFFSGDCSSKSFADETNNNNGEYNKVNENGWSCPDPDLGWVNELLM